MANRKKTQSEDSLRVDFVPIDSISPDPANVRLHPDRNLAALKSSLSRFGFQKPLVVDRNNVIRAGNGSWLAAKSLGMTHVPIHRTNLTGDEATAFAIADNRTAELADWDDDLLLRSLKEIKVDSESLGFDDGDIAELELAVSLSEQLAEELGLDRDGGGSGKGNDPVASHVRVVISVDDLATVERSLKDSGETDRGKAIAKVCREWSEKRQLHHRPEGS